MLTTPALALTNPSQTLDSLKTIQPSSASDWWPMFCHDETRTANTSAPAPDITHAVWNHTVEDWIEASPSLVDGKSYVATCNWWKGHFHCLDLYNGSYLWNYTINVQLFSSPAVSDGVYDASLNGRVSASTSTGNKCGTFY
jgi:outer membrane protein assembly factor BamB